VPATLKLTASTTAELDLSTYLNVQEDAGLDPADGAFLAPSFNDSTIGAGQALVNIDAANKELVFSLQLKAATKDALHALVQSIRRKLDEPNLDVEWRDHNATLSTFYDLEYGRLEPTWRYFKARQNWVGANLHLWTRPYGHTATTRLVATAQASGHGAPVMLIGSLAGDVNALAQYTLQVASYGEQGEQEAIIAAVLPSPSYPFRWPAASLALAAGGGASRIGASGAAGSQFIGRASFMLGPLTLCSITMPFPAAMAGRHRVLATVRGAMIGGISMYAVGRDIVGSVAITATSWTLTDFGVWNVPSQIASVAGGGLSFLTNATAGASGALSASYRYQINEVYLVPEDTSCVLRQTWNSQSRFTLDGMIGAAMSGDPSFMLADDITDGLIGQIPAIPPSATVAVAMLHAPLELTTPGDIVPPSQSVAVELRVRERFSFQR
jgi:hypothetical protein